MSYVLVLLMDKYVSQDKRCKITTYHYPPSLTTGQTSDGWKTAVQRCVGEQLYRGVL